ncbi:MAG: hypothetical protein AAF799_00660 [Myxococcota bacterium]
MTTRILQIKRSENRFGWVIRFASASSGIITFMGLVGTQPLWLATLLASVSVVLASVGWTFLLRAWPRANRRERGMLLRLVALPVLGLVVLSSSVIGIFGLATPQAIRQDMVQITDEVAPVIQAQRSRIEAEQQLLPLLEQAAREFAAMAEDEATRGRFTGHRGRRGRIYGDLKALAGNFEAAANTFREGQEGARLALREAQIALGQLRRLSLEAGSGRQELRRASEGYRQALETLAGALTRARLSPLESTLSIVEAGIAQQRRSTTTARSARRREREEAAATAVGQIAAQSQRRLDDLVGGLPSDSPQLLPMRLALPVEAVAKHWPYILPLAAYVLAIDLVLPALMIVMLGFLHQRLRHSSGTLSEDGGQEALSEALEPRQVAGRVSAAPTMGLTPMQAEGTTVQPSGTVTSNLSKRQETAQAAMNVRPETQVDGPQPVPDIQQTQRAAPRRPLPNSPASTQAIKAFLERHRYDRTG